MQKWFDKRVAIMMLFEARRLLAEGLDDALQGLVIDVATRPVRGSVMMMMMMMIGGVYDQCWTI